MTQCRRTNIRSQFGTLRAAPGNCCEELLTQIMATQPSKPEEPLTPPLPCYSRQDGICGPAHAPVWFVASFLVL